MLRGSGPLRPPKMRLRRASKSGSLNFFGVADMSGGDSSATIFPFLMISTCWPSATQSNTLPKAWRSCLTLAVFMSNKDVILRLTVCQFSEMTRLALEEFPVAVFADEFSIAHSHLTAHRYHARAALDFPAFKRAVIEIHVLRFHGNFAAIVRVIDHEVGIRAGLDRAFAREKIKRLRNLRAGGVHERVQVNLPRLHAVGVEQVDAFFERRNPIGNLGEIIFAHRLLRLEIERTVVGGNGLHEAVAQAVPENFLIPLVAQRRRHDKFRAFKLRFLRVGFVEREILDERLDGDAHAALPRGDGLIERFLATQVNDVSRRAGEFGEGHQMMHALGLDARRTAGLVKFRASLASGNQFLATLAHERFVLTMRGDDDAEFLRQLERAIKLRVVHAKRTFVGEEDFERTDATPYNFAKLFLGCVVKLRHAHVKGKIASGLADGLFHPKLETFQRVILARRTTHLNERGGAANERRFAAGDVIIFGKRAHERQVNVDMRVNEAGKNKFPLRINHLRAFRWRDAAVNARDGFVFAKNVRDIAFAGGDDFAVFNKNAHDFPFEIFFANLQAPVRLRGKTPPCCASPKYDCRPVRWPRSSNRLGR